MQNVLIFNAAQILKNKKISVTSHRIKLLEYMAKAGKPMTKTDIVKAFPGIHRVTMHRLLQQLTRAGILHLQKNQQTEIYFLKIWNEESQHLHFTCVRCHNVFCLQSVQLNLPQEINGFIIENINFTASGLCATCARS